MNIENLIISFQKFKKNLVLSNYLQQICSSIIDQSISKSKVEEILQNENVDFFIAKVDFLNLIFEYIKGALEDNILTNIEKENIKFLKIIFRIKPGDFYFHNKPNIEAAINFQLARIYLDNNITTDEALLKVDLQEIFDLSFDQMNDYAKTEAAISIQNGADINNLDIFFTNKEFFKLK